MDSLEEKQRISELIDIYGGLLTDRQRELMELYYNEDLSFGEIAESENISRQAVHDTIQHGKKALNRFEEQLGLISKKQRVDNDSNGILVDADKMSILLDKLILRLRDDIIYEVTPIRKIALEMKELLKKDQ